jgi:RNA polymerase sigma-70 factor (ECF subfamily)
MFTLATLPEQAFVAAEETRAELRAKESELLLLIYRQMRSLVGPHPDLDDLVQTALEQVLLAKFEGRSRLSTFTHSICFRVWMKHLRSLYRWRSVFSFQADEEPRHSVETRTPLSEVEAEERLRHFYRVIERISPKRRAVVLLHDISGEDIPTIAQIVGTSEATVRTRLRDGRKRLKELLEGDVYYGRVREDELASKEGKTS